MKIGTSMHVIKDWPVVKEMILKTEDELTNKVTKTKVMWPVETSWQNLEAVLQTNGIKIARNEMTQEVEIYIGGRKEVKNIDDFLPVVQDLMWDFGLYTRNGNLPADTVIYRNIDSIAAQNKYHPVLAWFTTLNRWDGQDYISQLFSALELDKDKSDPEFSKILLKKWLLQTYLMLANEGDMQAEGVLILAGEQGIGKTRFCQHLVPREYAKKWVLTGQGIDPDDKDSRFRASRYWIMEIGELGQSVRKTKIDSLKNYFTARADVLRRPYARSDISIPRRTGYIGTINPAADGAGFLRDEENRRYWPIFVEKINIDKMPDPSKLWAQVATLARTETYVLSDDEKAKLREMNRPNRRKTPAEYLLYDKYEWDNKEVLRQWRTASAIAAEIGINPKEAREVGRALAYMIKDGVDIQVAKQGDHHGQIYYLPVLAEGTEPPE